MTAIDRSFVVERYINLQTASNLLGLSVRTIRERMRDLRDPLPAFRIGGRLLFRPSELQEWIERRRVRPVDVAALTRDLMSRITKED